MTTTPPRTQPVQVTSGARRSGFTLLELLVVIGIISMLAVVTVISIQRVTRDVKLSNGVNRVLGALATSQIRLNQLWEPPRMALGDLYAEAFRNLAIGLVYAPIYPPAFLFTAAYVAMPAVKCMW